MRCICVVVGLAAAGAGVAGQAVPNRDGELIAGLERDVAAGKPGAEDAFWNLVAQRHSPIVEAIPGDDKDVLASFVWHDPGDTKSVVLGARLNAVEPLNDPAARMKHIAGTRVWYVSHRLPVNAELLYQFLVNPSENGSPDAARTARPDPLNPLLYPTRDDPMYDPDQLWRDGSIARMPAVPDNPWLTPARGAAAGATREHDVASAFLTMANPRKVWVHVPPGGPTENPNLLILFDGGTTYQSRIPTTTILDNLYAAHRVGPTIAVLVDNGGAARAFDMTFNDAFVKFLADELVPWVQREYHFKAEASRTVLGGDSLCGLIGAYAVLRRPDVFGKVLAQSGAFQFANSDDKSSHEPEWLARQFITASRGQMSFYLEVGTLENRPEGNDGTSLLASNRHLRDVLTTRGITVQYEETYGDHDPVHWRRMLPDAFEFLLK
jgi:enterochelin esterase-like enzyme